MNDKRPGKGKSILATLDNYVVVDIETTGLDPWYDCIIEVAAIRVENSIIIDKFQSLINPKRNGKYVAVDSFITELTGITNEMISDAPLIERVLPQFRNLLNGHIIIAHNANFDINFIYDVFELKLKQSLSNDFIDTMRISRRLFRQYSHHRLMDLTERFGIKGNIEHRALSDAIKTYECYEYMKSYAIENEIDMQSLYPKYISAKDITTMRIDFNEESPIYARSFVFTGTLEKMSRRAAMQAVVDNGGICADGISRKVNYLVLGINDYNKVNGKTTKHKKAEELKIKGNDIEIISENVFYEMLSDYTDISI